MKLSIKTPSTVAEITVPAAMASARPNLRQSPLAHGLRRSGRRAAVGHQVNADAGGSLCQRIRQGSAQQPKWKALAAGANDDLRRMLPPCQFEDLLDEIAPDDAARLRAQLFGQPEGFVELPHCLTVGQIAIRTLDGNDDPPAFRPEARRLAVLTTFSDRRSGPTQTRSLSPAAQGPSIAFCFR